MNMGAVLVIFNVISSKVSFVCNYNQNFSFVHDQGYFHEWIGDFYLQNGTEVLTVKLF